jgi:hypothetical protein
MKETLAGTVLRFVFGRRAVEIQLDLPWTVGYWQNDLAEGAHALALPKRRLEGGAASH